MIKLRTKRIMRPRAFCTASRAKKSRSKVRSVPMSPVRTDVYGMIPSSP